MDLTYSALGQPGVGFFSMLIIGLLAGWIASASRINHGLLTNLLVGSRGSFVGGKLAEF